MDNSTKYTLLEATKNDMPCVLELINDLALYEKAPEQVITTVSDLERYGFGEKKIFDCFVAKRADGETVGFALVFFKYSTWRGKAIYLEDLYIKPECRKDGVGSMLFKKVVQHAKLNECQRMEWVVLDWNEPALNFYNKMGANLEEQWTVGQLFPKDFHRILKG
jgi:GNAT superfamily N-acetyltransferase